VSRICNWEGAVAKCERFPDESTRRLEAPATDVVARQQPARYRWWLLMMPK
jgi:hypothetical protein